ncbi:InlB B-repeat-containing protein, partial [Finegoldia sp. P3-F-LR]
MNNKKIFEKIITEKRAKSSNERPKYGLRKLTVGVVSCLLGYMMFFTPNVVAAEKVEQPQAVEATVESTEVENTENVKEESEQPKEEAAESKEAVDTTEAEQPVSHVQAYSSKATETNAQDRTVRTTAEKTSETATEGKTEQAKQSDSYVPELEAIKVVKGQSVEDYRKAFKNLPEDATIKVETPADTTTDGEKIATIQITFADQSTKKEIITVKVYETQEELDKSEFEELEFSELGDKQPVTAPNEASEEFTEDKAKENWDKDVQDKSRWAIGKDQRLVRVGYSDPIKMSDIDYDGVFEDADGNTVIRLVYKERESAETVVWYRARFNFGELDQFIDYDKSYVVGSSLTGNEKGTYNLIPVNDRKEREINLSDARGDITAARYNLPINLVLKDKMKVADLVKKNYTVQMRLTDKDGKRIYAYAPKKTSMDYSTYTKTTSVALEDNINNTFLKGGKQKDGNNATSQETFFSEFIANPKEYKDESQLGIIRTQYYGDRSGLNASPTTGGQPIGFTQVFDKNLVNYLKADDAGNIAYVNLLTTGREVSPYAHRFGIKKSDINYTKDGKSAYIVIAPNAYQKDGLNKVEVEKHDQYTMLQGFYISSIDYVVDKTKLAETFNENKTRKLDYSMMSGWTNPNNEGWTVYEKKYENGYVARKGESFLVNTTTMPEGGQIMIKIGDSDQAIIRKQQGYYTYKAGGTDNAIEKIETISKNGIFKFTLREGATIKAGDTLKVYMPYTADHKDPVNFMEVSNGTERDQGAATLDLDYDKQILTTHIFKDYKVDRGYYKVRYTPKGKTEEASFEFKIVGKSIVKWEETDKKMIKGLPNRAVTKAEGNFQIDLTKVEPGTDIIIESYNSNGELQAGETSSIRYSNLAKIDQYKDLTWTDSSDKLSILSINKSLYKPYQVIFTNDYVEGTDDFYKDPHVMPTDNANFMTNTSKIQGYTKYDGGLIRMRTELINNEALLGKAQALADEYDDKGNLTTDNSSNIDLKGEGYRVYRYDIDLNTLGTIGAGAIAPRDAAGEDNSHSLKLLKDKKLYFNASDGSSLPTELVEARVRTRVLFDTTEGQFEDASKKSIRIAPDNVKYLDDEGYVANGFTGANVAAGTGDEFVKDPTAEGKTFLGWVTEAGKAELGATTVKSAAFNKLDASMKFTSETPITTHLVVYAIYSNEKLVTFDANGGKFADDSTTKTDDISDGVNKPADPKLEGKEFVGWAKTADAKEADVIDVTKLTEPTTVYAVWKDADEQTSAEPTITEPKAGDTSVSGTGVPGATVVLKDKDGNKIGEATVDKDGKWTVDNIP